MKQDDDLTEFYFWYLFGAAVGLVSLSYVLAWMFMEMTA